MSAKKVSDINTSIPLDIDTNSGKLIAEIENKNPSFTYYKTNLVKCLPLSENDKIRYPYIEEMTLCINNLIMEFNIVKPKIVFLLGGIVSKFILNYINKNNIKFDIKFVSIEHPSYICVYKRQYKDKYINKITSLINEEIYVKND